MLSGRVLSNGRDTRSSLEITSHSRTSTYMAIIRSIYPLKTTTATVMVSSYSIATQWMSFCNQNRQLFGVRSEEYLTFMFCSAQNQMTLSNKY